MRLLFVMALFAIPFAAADCEDADHGSAVDAGDSDLSTTMARASTANDANFVVVEYDPDDDVSANEVYYLRFAETHSASRIQVGDLNLMTGQILEPGSTELDRLSSRIDDSFAATARFISYVEGGSTFWFFDADASADLTRHDVRITPVSIDSGDYDAGSFVFLSHNDYKLFADQPPADSLAGWDDNDAAWHDADEDEEVSGGDCILLQPGGFDASPDVGDVRLTGTHPGTDTETETESETDTDTDTGTDTESETDTETDTPTETETQTTTGTDTETPETETDSEPTIPALPLMGLLAAFGVAVLVRRRF